MIKAILKTFKREYFRSFIIGMSGCLTDMLSPFLIQRIIQFLEGKDGSEDNYHGYVLVSMLVVTQFISYMCGEHQFYNNCQAGQTCA